MARFDSGKVATFTEAVKLSVNSMLRRAATASVGSKKMRVALALLIASGVLSAGLAFLLVQKSEDEQLDAVAQVSERASQRFRDRFAGLSADVVELSRRVGEASRAAQPDAHADAATPIEVRFRRQLEASIRDLAGLRDDVLDMTYLGRLRGAPSGKLMVVRVERKSQGPLQTSEVDPRPKWDAAFLRRVMQNAAGVSLVSAPIVNEGSEDGEARVAVIRGATSVADADGSVVGVVLMSLDLSKLLEKVSTSLPNTWVPLLVADGGEVLLHPGRELSSPNTKSGIEVLRGAYPGLWEAFEAQKDTHAFSYFGDSGAQRLLRFEVGGEASKLQFSWVLSEPKAQIEVFSQARLAHLVELADLDFALFENPVGLLALAVVLVLSAVLLFRKLKMRRRRLSVADAGNASALEERARKIEAENRARVDEVDATQVQFAREGASSDPLPDLAAEFPSKTAALGPTEAVEEASQTQDGEREERVAVAADEEATAAAPEPFAGPRVPEASLASARGLVMARNRLEEELEVARQRALDELAAARERFELELAQERALAIDRLVEESRSALAAELGGLEASAHPVAIPPIEDREFDLRQLLTEVAAWMGGETHGRTGAFKICCNRNVPDRLRGDPDWMGPLLVHMGRNAIQGSAEGPVELFVSCTDDGDAGIRLCFELRAGELGLESDAAGKVRECAAQGLGLTEEIVESMRGELELETSTGSGSTLRMIVPMSLPG